MKLQNFLLISAIIIIVFSCNSKNDKNGEIPVNPKTDSNVVSSALEERNPLSGHVYYFGPEFDSIQCKVLAECDCCSDDFIFLNDTDFIRIGYCEVTKEIKKGVYTFSSKNLILKYDPISLYTEANDMNEVKKVSKGSKEYLIKSDKAASFTDTLSQFRCKDKIFFKNNSEKSFGGLEIKDSIQTFIKELKEEGFWKKLN